MDNTLGYLDHVLFLSQQALDHGPVVQLTWVYDRAADLEALRRFQHNLGRGMLGRRVARSPLPFGRHRWIAWPGPHDVEVAAGSRPRAELGAWADEQGRRRIDPERTPWRLTVQPLAEGGTAVSLLVSHTIGDGIGLLRAVADAANGVTADFGFPPVDDRTRSQALREDWREFLSSIPDLARAVAQVPGSARDLPSWGQDKPRRAGTGSARSTAPVVLHSVSAHLDARDFGERARSLGGTPNSLFLGFVARFGQALGWAAGDGSLNLAIPVSEREDDEDVRGNALNGVTLRVDPATVTAGLGEVRSGLKAALAEMSEKPNALAGPLALTPLIPKFVARQVEVKAQQARMISCSNLGVIDPAVNRPDGTDAQWFTLRTFWNRLACRGRPIERAGGVLFPVEAGRVHDTMFITVCYASADPSFTGEGLRDLVRRALDDFGLNGDLE